MRIVVLNGSPKGETSVTMQYVKFMEKKYPEHEFVYIHASQSVRRLEREEEAFRQVVETVKSADGVLWAFPLYVCLVHAQYKRFIELIWERRAEEAFRGKHTALLATSIHFFDHTALDYMHGICDDLGMRVVDSFSADMQDLMQERERMRLRAFGEGFFKAVESGHPGYRAYSPLVWEEWEYTPAPVEKPLDLRGKRAIIVTDSASLDHNAGRMVDRFRRLTGAELIDLSVLNIKGGCTGCIQCGFDNICIYTGRDEVEQAYNRMKEYDMIVMAGSIKDRYLSSRWKMFIDRRFFATHQPHFEGKQIAYLLSGPLGQLHQLRENLNAITELDQANLTGIVTDEYRVSADIDARMEALVQQMVDNASRQYVRPRTFLGIGGMKIFRDDIFGRLRFPFQGDHRYYKKHGVYDFPQKQYGTRLTYAILGLMIKLPPVKKSIRQNMKQHMIAAHRKVVETK